MNSITDKAMQVLANLAIRTAKTSANQACAFHYHQPKPPAELNKLRKF